MRACIAVAGAVAASAAGPATADPFLAPGLYRVEVRVALPNVQYAAAPIVLTRCLSDADLESGRAFFVLSENPLKNCDLLDYEIASGIATYRILCPGPNRGSAVAAFKAAGAAYRGTIRMNMGGKSMTMSELQIGRRIGDCQ